MSRVRFSMDMNGCTFTHVCMHACRHDCSFICSWTCCIFHMHCTNRSQKICCSCSAAAVGRCGCDCGEQASEDVLIRRGRGRFMGGERGRFICPFVKVLEHLIRRCRFLSLGSQCAFKPFCGSFISCVELQVLRSACTRACALFFLWCACSRAQSMSTR